jgi:hypothetical protein
LDDVIRYVETDLFEKISGLTIEDFETLNKHGFFDVALLDDTVLLFRVFEEPSLKYLGIVRNANREYGLFSKTISESDFNEIKNDLRKD